jgi:PAS domain S-box-containing protein
VSAFTHALAVSILALAGAECSSCASLSLFLVPDVPPTAASGVFLSSAAVVLCLLGIVSLLVWLGHRVEIGGLTGSPDNLPDHIIPDDRLLAFSRVSKIMSLLSGTLGALVLAGWAAGVPVLKSIGGDYPDMTANAAFCLLAAGLALWLAGRNASRVQTTCSRILAAFTTLISALTLWEYITGWDLHIDQALVASTATPDRMALISALSLFLIGIALVVLGTRRFTLVAQMLALLTGALCLLSINCYLFGIHHFEGVSVYAASAVHTPVGLLLLSVGILFCCPDRGLMRTIALPAPGGVMALRLLPSILILPSLLGWIRWQGQLQGYYDTAFGLALFTSITAVCFFFLIWTTASLLNRLDRARLQSDCELRDLNDNLEARVMQRTAELQASEQAFRSIIDAVKDYSIITLDAAGNVTTWNAGAERQKGYRAEEILGKHLSTFYSEEDKKKGLAHQELAVAASSGECRQEGWRVRKDGRRFWANVLITSVRDQDGNLRGFSKITQDITEQKQAQERFRLVVEAAPNAVMMVASDGRIALVNFQMEKLFGYDRAELIGQPVEMLVPARLRARHEGHRSGFFGAPATRAMDTSRDLVGVRKDGSEVPIEVGLNPLSTSEGEFVLASIIDITDRKKAEKMLRDQALIIDLASDTIFIRDREDRITYWNQGAERLYGWSKEEVLGQVAHILLKTQFPLPMEQLQAQLLTAGHWSGELIHTRRDGSLVTVASAWTLQRDEENRLAAVLEMNYDITERKRAQKALNEANDLLELRVAELAQTNRELAGKSEEVEAFVYIVSHDLRAPLVNLQGFSRELEMSCDELRENLLPILFTVAETNGVSSTLTRVHSTLAGRIQAILQEEIPGSLRYISASTHKFGRLIDALLELSRHGREAHRPEALDLNAMVSNTLDLMHLSIAASGARIAVGPMPRVQGDATAIGQVFSNLIGNSLKYLQPGRPGQIEIGGEMEAGVAHCWVRDNGAGLPPGAQTRLFQVFQRFHPQLASGEGMGLAIVKRIVERHGGKIWAEGEEGVGTTFHFTLSDG